MTKHWGVVDPAYTTEVRIQKALSEYEFNFGKLPDRIIMSTAVWDLGEEYLAMPTGERDLIYWGDLLHDYRNNTYKRLDQLRELLGNRTQTVDIGLRTAAWTQQGGHLLSEINKITRDIVAKQDLTFFDMDHDVWSIVNFETSDFHERALFAEDFDPKPILAASVAAKLLGLRYSSFYKLSNAFRAEIITKTDLDGFETFDAIHPLEDTVMVCESIHATSQLAHTPEATSRHLQESIPGVYRGLRSHRQHGNARRKLASVGSDLRHIPLAPLMHCGNYEIQLLRTYESGDLAYPYMMPLLTSTDGSTITYKMQRIIDYDSWLASLYFTTLLNGTRYRWGGVTTQFLGQNMLGPADVVFLEETELRDVPVRGTIPISFLTYLQDHMAVVTSPHDGRQHLWIPSTKELRLLPSKAAVQFFSTPGNDQPAVPYPAEGFDGVWVTSLGASEGSPLPDVYQEGSLVRYFRDKKVFMFVNSTRIPMTSQGITAEGKTFDDVNVLSGKQDLQIVPIKKGWEPFAN
jgi:hypothetical protein